VNDPQYNPAPANWADLVRQKIYYDPDPVTGIDRSLRQYLFTVSYGRALLEADVLGVVNVGACDINAAIEAGGNAHLYETVGLIFTGGPHGCTGWAFWDSVFPFNPPRLTNALRNWFRVNMDEPVGTWAMEALHCLTGFGDLYQTTNHPGGFDEMACACGTHPSSFTKLKLNWLDPSAVARTRVGSPSSFELHALANLQPLYRTRLSGQ
jgi:hypothetical protein